MKVAAIFGLALLFLGVTAYGQDCPREDASVFSVPSASRSIEGQVIFHEGIRSWFGLRSDIPICGQKEIELIVVSDDEAIEAKKHQLLQTVRGCRVTVHGKLDISPTAYYSTDLFQNVEDIEPAPGCVPKTPFPDTSKARPERSIRSYMVTAVLDYQKDTPISFVVREGDLELHPWQAYAKYFLNGEEDFAAYCADDFNLRLLESSPNSQAQEMDNQILAIAPETGDRRVTLRYECKRASARK